MKGDFSPAVADYTEVINAIALPFKSRWIVKRAKAYEALGKIDEAIADYTSSMRFDLSSEIYRGRAALYKLKGDDAGQRCTLI